MRAKTFAFPCDDGVELHVYQWLPEAGRAPKAVVHVAHGMAEHAARYERFARALTGADYAVYANDHRGHGRTAPGEADLGFFATDDGWNRCVADLALLIRDEQRAHPGLPLVLFGHSMGSMMTQQALYEYGGELAGAVLSGSSGKPPAIAALGRLIARAERLRLGPRGRSRLLRAMTFDDFNKKFAPNRTGFDWLSRDETEVDAYVADPLCGFDVTVQLWIDMLDALPRIADPAQQARVPKDLPVLVMSGDKDPVGAFGKSVRQLADAYRAAGLGDVTCTLYPDGRHEMLNELNRDEVTADVVAWLDRVTAAA